MNVHIIGVAMPNDSNIANKVTGSECQGVSSSDLRIGINLFKSAISLLGIPYQVKVIQESAFLGTAYKFSTI